MRKRSKYRPYRRDPGAWSHAIAMQQAMTDDQLRDLGIAVHTAIEPYRHRAHAHRARLNSAPEKA